MGQSTPVLAAGRICETVPRCAECGVRETSLCGSLDTQALAALHAMGRRHRIVRGQTLAWAGEDSHNCANLLSGVLKLTASTADGREQIVGLLYPSDFVGRPYADRTDYTITALSDAEICVFPRHGFEKALETYSAMERELLRRTFVALDHARARMLMLARQSAAERVAGFLLDMADRAGGGDARVGTPFTFELPLSRGAIGDVLGLTIETVSRQMTRLKNDGVVKIPGGRAVTIVRRDMLEARAEAA